MALIHWLNRWDVPLGELDVVSATHTEALDGEDLLEVTCTDQTVSKGDRLLWKAPDGRWHEHVVDTIANRRQDGYPVTELKCISSMVYDLSHTMMQDTFATAVLYDNTLTDAINSIVSQPYYTEYSDNRWARGTVEDAPLNIQRDGNLAVVSKASVLAEIAETGIEIYPQVAVSGNRVSSRSVCAGTRGDQTAQWRFEWSCNADAITRHVDSHDPVSRLFVYGRTYDDQSVKRRLSIADAPNNPYRTPSGDVAPYIESTDALNQWGLPNADGSGKVPTADVVFFEEVKYAADLYNAGVSAWHEMRKLRVRYEVDSISITSEDPEASIGIGDSVQVVDRGLTPALEATGRVTRLVRDLVTGGATASIGASSRPLSNRFAALQARNDSIDRRLSAIE